MPTKVNIRPLHKLTRGEIAKASGLQNVNGHNWVKKGYLAMDRDGLIDILEPSNLMWLLKRVNNGYTFDMNLLIKEKALRDPVMEALRPPVSPPEQKEDNPPAQPEAGGVAEMQREKMKLELKKMNLAIELDTIKKQKLEGNVIPTDAVTHLFINAIITIKATYQQNIDSIVNVFKQRLDIDHSDFVEISKQLREINNETHKDAKKSLLAGIDNIVQEYMEVRGRGEKK